MEAEGPNAPQGSDPVPALDSGWVRLVREARPALQASDTGCLPLSTGFYFLWARLQPPRPLPTKACEVLHACAPSLCSTPSQAPLSPPRWPCTLTPQPLPQHHLPPPELARFPPPLSQQSWRKAGLFSLVLGIIQGLDKLTPRPPGSTGSWLPWPVCFSQATTP